MNEQECESLGIISINRNAIIQYILIYLLIQYIGGRVLAALGTDFFYGGTLILCMFLMLQMPNRLPLKKNVFGYLLILGVSLGISFVITGGALSIGTILSIISRFILVYVAIQFDMEHFMHRFLKLAYIMACLSLIEFVFVQIIGVSNALDFFSRLYEIKNGSSWLGNSYGLFFVCYNFMDPTRNAYMFGEPGEYQMLLITALYFMTFYSVDLEKKEKIRYYVVFFAALLTTQSTTGYFNLIAFAVAVLLTNREQVRPFVKRILLVLIVALIIYLFLFYSENSFLYKNFFAKILTDNNTIDLATNTGIARTGPMERFVETVNIVPQKLLFGVGFSGLASLPLGGYTTCGLINSIAMIGVISSVLLYGKMSVALLVGAKSIIQVGLGLFLVVNMGFSQPDILSIMSVLICMYGIYSNRKESKKIMEAYYE